MKPSHPRSATSFSTVQLAIRDGLISIPLGALIGSACAGFLWSLDTVTKVRIDHPFIIYFLPVAGIGLGWVYTHFGKSTAPGNNLVIHSIRSAQPVPRRMAPIIFLSTLATHLFGGSAGREGTAVQMGAGMASAACGLFKPSDVSRQTLLLSGVAAGFGGVFGTPFAGAVFCLEMIAHNRPSLWMFFPSAVAAFTSDYTCRLWGVVHTSYPVNLPMPDSSFGRFIGTDGLLISKILIAALTFGLVAKAFALAANESKKLFEKLIPCPYRRPFFGGVCVLALASLLGHDKLGLGTFSTDPDALTISSFFNSAHIPWSTWLSKAALTICTLSSGFKGGEVTPLFFVGASLGHTAAEIFAAPYDLFAALGLVSVFGAASHTPLACTILGCELFGYQFFPYFAVSCFVAKLVCGRASIYRAQFDFSQPPATLRRSM